MAEDQPIIEPQEEEVSPEVVEAMGISQPAFEEILGIVGHRPTVAEFSTLLAMWEANGKQQSLYGWLKGQHHVVELHEYLYTGTDESHKEIREPRMKECYDIAHRLCRVPRKVESPFRIDWEAAPPQNIYFVGHVGTDFLDSEYARKYLHLVEDPVQMTSVEEDVEYLQLILSSLHDNGIVCSYAEVASGGLFGSLLRHIGPWHKGFDILTCREVRMDAFLFGEEKGRFLATLPEQQDDFFLSKMDEARVNCCFLGRVTKGRVLVDGMDFGDISEFA